MRRRTRATLTAVATVLALAVTGGTTPASAAGPEPASTGGEYTISAVEPESLIPADATDRTTHQLLRQLFRGLVAFDADGNPVLDQAESIEKISDDPPIWDIWIREDAVFFDGVPAWAEAYIRGWTHAADGPHGQHFERIVDMDAAGRNLVVELDEPYADFFTLLGHPAFTPMHPDCEFDLQLCQVSVRGNGPYLIDGLDWEPGDPLTLVRNENYPGPDHAVADRVNVQLFPDLESLCGALRLGPPDVIYPSCISWMELAPVAVNRDDSYTFDFLGLPSDAEGLELADVRRALSLAIDWETIVGSLPPVLPNIAPPNHVLADSLVSPLVDGHRPGICQPCEHDPEAAAALLDEAGGWTGGELALWAPAGFGHEQWLTSVGDQIEAALGIEYRLEVSLGLTDYLAAVAAGEVTGPYWFSWHPEYPTMEAYLSPLFRTGGSANFSGYSNAEVDFLLDEAGRTGDPAELIAALQQAEEVVLEDLPVIPMWFEEAVAGYRTDRIDEFVWNRFHGPEYGLIAPHQS